MRFNESEFRQLVQKTTESVMRLGTTSHVVLDRYDRAEEMLSAFLRSVNEPFTLIRGLEWVNSLEHDPASEMSASYVEWIALHRFVHLLAEQQAGTLTHWRHYLSAELEQPKSPCFQAVLEAFSIFLCKQGMNSITAKSYCSNVRRMLMYFENQGITQFQSLKNHDVAGYFLTDRFKSRKLKGFQTELCSLKKFLNFLLDNGYTHCETLCDALPKIRGSEEKIITTVDKQIEDDLLADEPNSLVNKRDQAVLLLALHTGLRGCDIRSLRFQDIDWEKEVIHIRQKKTGADLVIPIDPETQNAVIDYILNERRSCASDLIFVTAVGPTQKMKRVHYRIKYRAKGTDSYDRLPHDGLHIYRRTFATRLLQSGASLPAISEMLGHTDKNSVQAYLSTDEVRMKRCALDLSHIPCQREEY